MEASLCGLMPRNVKSIVCKFCEAYGISHNFIRNTKEADRNWFTKFMRRHTELSVCSLETVSVQHAIIFNEERLTCFSESA